MIDFVEFRRILLEKYMVNFFQANMVIRRYQWDINRASSVQAAIEFVVKTENIKPKT